MPITLDGSSLTIEKLVAIARDNEKVELAPEALERIKVCRAMLEEKLAKKEVMYGTNTGIGEFSETMLNDEQVKEYENARVIRASAMADRILDICDQVESGLLDAQQGKLIADNMKWIAARLDPHLWGDRIQIKAEVKTSAEQHLDAVRQLSEMIKKGKEGVVIEGEHVTKVIEHQPTIEELLS